MIDHEGLVLVKKGDSVTISCQSHDDALWFFQGYSQDSMYTVASPLHTLTFNSRYRDKGFYFCYGLNSDGDPFVQPMEIIVYGEFCSIIFCYKQNIL